MLTHAGMLEYRQFDLPLPGAQADVEAAWTAWKEHESRARYTTHIRDELGTQRSSHDVSMQTSLLLGHERSRTELVP